MERRVWFEKPTQVKIYDIESPPHGAIGYLGGIAYQDYVICECCGKVFDIETLYNEAERIGLAPNEVITTYDDWVDVSEYIID